ncbi:Hydroxymethylpyrimidine/phosphomethylpyrimidine kinase [Chlamydia trachomatis]|nr:Hydroxymethylpyrimidine/phosphomethylpyrimidine kinase [Chlamydia trachomatis]
MLIRKKVLTIAGSDSSGGAGIQADIKTMLTNGVYAMSCITALTAQNTTGVSNIMEVSPEFLDSQLESVFEDIFPDAVKIGMVSSSELIEVIAKNLKKYSAKNIVVDPVMVATSGSSLIQTEAVKALKEKLFPLADLITPNLQEAEVLSGKEINSIEDMVEAAKLIYEESNVAVLLKGGHLDDSCDDLLYDGEETWFRGKKIANQNTHGTGCTLSSAIASNLAKGHSLADSIYLAKLYLNNLLMRKLDLGSGSGPLDHGYFIAE